MDKQVKQIDVPLVIDLDGTLIATDLLWEGLFKLLRANPFALLLLPLWLLGGSQRVKSEIASRVTIDPATLPYRTKVLNWLRREHAEGRKLVLATGAAEPFARAIAAHLGIFDKVLASSPSQNLTSEHKRHQVTNYLGDSGFDYVGNSKADLVLFDAARHATVVAPDGAARRWQQRHDAELIEAPKTSFKTIIKMLRVHQWSKNALIAVPLVLAHQHYNLDMVVACLLGFLVFSLTASSIYILNDLLDLELDRKHATKCNRPLASGRLSIPFGLCVMTGMLIIAATICVFLPPLFSAVMALYLCVTTAYSLYIKRMLLIDVFTLASLYSIRLLAGIAVTGIEKSFWLLAFSTFFFLSLALVKRFVELKTTEVPVGQRIAGRGYRPEDMSLIAQAGVGATFSAALVLALYLDTELVRAQYVHTWMLWPLIPLVLYVNLRLWVLSHRGHMHDDPVVFVARDWRSLLMICIGALIVVVAGMMP